MIIQICNLKEKMGRETTTHHEWGRAVRANIELAKLWKQNIFALFFSPNKKKLVFY